MNLLASLLIAVLTTTVPKTTGTTTSPVATGPAIDVTTPIVATGKPAPPWEKTRIFLQTDAIDPIGAAYVAALRKAIEMSSTCQSVSTPAEARFVVGIMTMDPNEMGPAPHASEATIAAITLQRQTGGALTEFVNSWVLFARKDAVDVFATELVSAINKEIRDLETPPIQ